MRGSERVLSLLLLAATFDGAQEDAPSGLGLETPLRNDLVLPIHARAQAEMERGDRAWSRAERGAAFDAWRAALETSAAGDSVTPASGDPGQPHPFPTVDGSDHRRSEGVAYAVLRRLAAVSPEDRAAWRARFAPLSESAIEEAGADRRRLARLERDLPLTEGALRAALRLFDLDFEAGRPLSAAAWCGRRRSRCSRSGPS
jgi:hypothetical protein